MLIHSIYTTVSILLLNYWDCIYAIYTLSLIVFARWTRCLCSKILSPIIYKICLLLRFIIPKNALSQAHVILATFGYSLLELWWIFSYSNLFCAPTFWFSANRRQCIPATWIVSCLRHLHFHFYNFKYEPYTQKKTKAQIQTFDKTKNNSSNQAIRFTNLCTKYIIDKAELHQHNYV